MTRFEEKKNRRMKVPLLAVDLTDYYGIGDEIIVGSLETREMFIQGRTGTIYFYNEDLERFVIGYREAYLSFGRKKHCLLRLDDSTIFPRRFASYHTSAIERGWYL